VMERLVIMTDEAMILPKHLPRSLQDRPEGILVEAPRTSEELKELKKQLRDKAVEEAESSFVLSALDRNEWNVSRAAKDVGMLRPNFQALMRKHNIRLAGPEE
jgi:DNA-binding NtrC family response regulator